MHLLLATEKYWRRTYFASDSLYSLMFDVRVVATRLFYDRLIFVEIGTDAHANISFLYLQTAKSSATLYAPLVASSLVAVLLDASAGPG